MASANHTPFFGGRYWFIPPIHLLHSKNSNFARPPRRPNFAMITLSDIIGKSDQEDNPRLQFLRSFYWELANEIDYRHTPEVEEILRRGGPDNPSFESFIQKVEESKDMEEIRNTPLMKIARRIKEIDDEINKRALEENSVPYHREDRKYWKEKPHIIGLDGRPMPRKSIKTEEEAHNKIWDFGRQFFFGLWGFKLRPYPNVRPCDIAQAIGYKNLERRYYDFFMKTGGFFYKDRLGRTRGPCELVHLRTAWGAGIIDKNTFIWGEDMYEWAPISHIYGMERAIATWEAKLGRLFTATGYKIWHDIPLWAPLKGHEKKSPKELQHEAMEDRRRDQAVLEANGGDWPSASIPSHALFLWAGGSELTNFLEEDDHMPNKYIPEYLRDKLLEVIPDLRPWEVLSIEQAMNQLAFHGKWYREPLGAYKNGPPYIRNWNNDVMELMKTFTTVSSRFYERMVEAIPGFDVVVDRAQKITAERRERLAKRKAAEKMAERERAVLGKTLDEVGEEEF